MPDDQEAGLSAEPSESNDVTMTEEPVNVTLNGRYASPNAESQRLEAVGMTEENVYNCDGDVDPNTEPLESENVIMEEERINTTVDDSGNINSFCRSLSAAEIARNRESYQVLNAQLTEEITRVSERRVDEKDLSVVHLSEKLDEIGGNFEKVFCGKDLAADAQVLETVSKLSFFSVQALQRKTASKSFSSKSFAKKLLDFIRGSEAEEAHGNPSLENWASFGASHDSKIFKPIPALNVLKPFLLLSEASIRPKKERIKREKIKAEAHALEALKEEVSHAGVADLTRQLDNVYKCLKKQMKMKDSDSVNFYEFCLHPTDFARTVENIFYLSFLVKETKVKIIQPDGQFPQITRVSEAEKLPEDDRSRVRTNQGIVNISVPQWKELVNLLGITEPAILPL